MSQKRDEVWGRVVEQTGQEALAEGRAAAFAEIVAMLRSGMCDLDEDLVAGANHALRVIEARAKEQSP